MSKDRSYTPTKSKKAKRVAAVSQLPQAPTRPGMAKPDAPKPGAPAKPAVAPAARSAARVTTAGLAGVTPWSISLETGLYVLIGLVAVAIRLYALGRFPLQESEGIRAWTAWSYYQGLPNASPATQMPLTIFGGMVSFLLFGASDWAVRLLPALGGIVCAFLPFALRREIGRAGALAAAAILAVSPSLVFVSRSMDGGIIVAAGALALIACALAYRREPKDAYVYTAAIVLGIMFAADRTAGPTVVILGIYAAISWLRSPEERDLPVSTLRNGAVLFVAIAIALGTGLLTNLQGVQSALIDPLTAWLAGATVGTIVQRIGFYLRILFVYEPLVLVFSIMGLVATAVQALRTQGVSLKLPSLRRGEDGGEDEEEEEDGLEERRPQPESTPDFAMAPFLLYWAFVTFIFCVLLGDQSPASTIQIVLPVALLAALFAGRVLESEAIAKAGHEVWVMAFLFILIVLSFIPFLSPASLFGGRFTSLEKRIQTITTIVLIILVAMMVILAIWYAHRLGLQRTLLGVGLAVALALSIFTVHSMWQLNQVSRADPTEPMLMQRTSDDVRLLLGDLVAVSRTQGDDGITITLDDRIPQPARWYLRRFSNVTVGRVSQTTKTAVIIVPAEARDSIAKGLGGAYVNQRYRLSSTWTPQAALINWLRWAHVREPIVPPKGTYLYAFYKLPQ